MNDNAVRRYIYFYPPALLLAWVIAWGLNIRLRKDLGWNAEADTLYWIAMKMLIWVLPVLVAIHVLERRSILEFLELGNVRKGLVWGCIAGIALVGVTYLFKTIPSGTVLHSPALTLVLANAVLVAPVVEEIVLRGFLLKRFEWSGMSFLLANCLTTAVFVMMHLPGWYMQARIPTIASLAQPVVALSLLSLVFGWTKHRAASLYASLIPHVLNNAYSSLSNQ